MKKILIKLNKKYVVKVMLLSMFLLLTMCVAITNVSQPAEASAGQLINISVDISVLTEVDDSQNLIFGFLAPVSWDAENLTTATYTSSVGDGTMSIAPAGEMDSASVAGLPWSADMATLFGLGENTEEMVWYVFKSDEVLVGANATTITGQVQLSVVIGPNVLNAELGYLAALKGYGINADDHSISMGHPIEVTPTVAVTYLPQSYTIDDVININYDAKEGFSGLLGTGQVYLCASAMVDGVLTTACDNNNALAMTNEGNDTWSLMMWPKNLFHVDASATLTGFTFSFTNEAGDIIIRDANTTQDFVLQENCSN